MNSIFSLEIWKTSSSSVQVDVTFQISDVHVCICIYNSWVQYFWQLNVGLMFTFVPV